jgi:riboflavin kinase/FMN adenylyltransferase
MRIVASVNELEEGYPDRPVYLTVGVFDGLHLGHRALIARTVSEAARHAGIAALLTFARHPLALLAPPYEPPRLASRERRRQLLESLGLDLMIEVDFDRDFSRLPAADFVREWLALRLGVAEVVCGATHRFGYKGEGDAELLRRMGPALGFTVFTPPMERLANGEVSSTGIRNWLLQGEVALAAAALARPYELQGDVARGDQRGRTLGYPTANVEAVERLLVPGRGVYACGVTIEGEPHPAGAMVNIGNRPTFDGRREVVEAHLFDFEGDLYGRSMSLHFVARLRDEMKFDGIAAIRAQLAHDADAARSALAPSSAP